MKMKHHYYYLIFRHNGSHSDEKQQIMHITSQPVWPWKKLTKSKLVCSEVTHTEHKLFE